MKQGNDFYVYTYAYPVSISGTVFYVGKGRGNRIDDHEREARSGHQCRKCEIVRSIWATGEKPVKKKEHEHLSEDDAYTLEARLIRQNGITNLANKHARAANPMTSEERTNVLEYTRAIAKAYGINVEIRGQEIDEDERGEKE